MSSLDDLKKIQTQINLLVSQKEKEEADVLEKKELDDFMKTPSQFFENDNKKFLSLLDKLPYSDQLNIACKVPYFKHSRYLRRSAKYLGVDLPKFIFKEIPKEIIPVVLSEKDKLIEDIKNKDQTIDHSLIRQYRMDDDVFSQVVESEYLPYFTALETGRSWCDEVHIAKTLVDASDDFIKYVRAFQKKQKYSIIWAYFIDEIILDDKKKDIVLHLFDDGAFDRDLGLKKFVKEIYP